MEMSLIDRAKGMAIDLRCYGGWKAFAIISALILLFSGCKTNNQDEQVDIVCTTGIIGDVVQRLTRDSLVVSSLMGPGVDPHLYKATQGDIIQLSRAEVIVYNGLHLEGKMGEIFKKLESSKQIIVASGGLKDAELINSAGFSGAYDPHIWFDVALWMKAVRHIASELKEHYPRLSSYISRNEQEYLRELSDLDVYCRTEVLLISDNQRVLITAHDAFKYFGRAYGMEVKGLQGISTTAEYGLRDISELVNFIVDRKIKAIFVESSVPQRSIEAVIEGCRQRGHQVVLGGELFSDALGKADTPEGNYIGMVKHNVNTIVDALL